MIVRLLKDDPRFKLFVGDLLEAEYADWDPSKVIIIKRLHDGYDPGCSQYKCDIKKLTKAEVNEL